MDDLEFDLLYPDDADYAWYIAELEAEYGEERLRKLDNLPDEWEMQLANAEPHNMTVVEYVGYGDDAEEREVTVEVRPNYPTKEQVFG